MTIEQIRELPSYQGIHVDRKTGKSYFPADSDIDPRETKYTFEDAVWTGPFQILIPWPKLNPLSFATKETADMVLAWARVVVPRHVVAVLDEDQNIVGPFTRTVERRIAVSVMGGSAREEFSAGQLAAKIIRLGPEGATKSWLAELQQARLA